METISINESVELYEDLRPKLIAYVEKLLFTYREHAYDVVQEAFCRLHKQKYEGLNDYVKPWLFNVCRNLAFKTIEKNKRLVFKETDEIDDVQPYEDLSPLELLQVKEETASDLQILNTAMQQLKPKAQRIIKLRFYNGLKYQEIADIEKMSVGHVGFAINDAVSRLRAAYVSLSKKENK